MSNSTSKLNIQHKFAFGVTLKSKSTPMYILFYVCDNLMMSWSQLRWCGPWWANVVLWTWTPGHSPGPGQCGGETVSIHPQHSPIVHQLTSHTHSAPCQLKLNLRVLGVIGNQCYTQYSKCHCPHKCSDT